MSNKLLELLPGFWAYPGDIATVDVWPATTRMLGWIKEKPFVRIALRGDVDNDFLYNTVEEATGWAKKVVNMINAATSGEQTEKVD